MAAILAEAFGNLPGPMKLVDPAPADRIDADGRTVPLELGRNLHLRVRPQASVQLLLTGHMATVFGVDHPFQSCRWTGPGVLNGPGVADMKGGRMVMMTAVERLAEGRGGEEGDRSGELLGW